MFCHLLQIKLARSIAKESGCSLPLSSYTFRCSTHDCHSFWIVHPLLSSSKRMENVAMCTLMEPHDAKVWLLTLPLGLLLFSLFSFKWMYFHNHFEKLLIIFLYSFCWLWPWIDRHDQDRLSIPAYSTIMQSLVIMLHYSKYCTMCGLKNNGDYVEIE